MGKEFIRRLNIGDKRLFQSIRFSPYTQGWYVGLLFRFCMKKKKSPKPKEIKKSIAVLMENEIEPFLP